MKPFKVANLSEEIQEYIADNSGLGYVVADIDAAIKGNFTIENKLDFSDIARLLDQPVLLTMFDEGGPVTPTGRQFIQEKTFRFVSKGTNEREALARSRNLMKWLLDLRTFLTTTYRIWILARSIRQPGILARGENNSFLADFLVLMQVYQRT